MAAEEGEEVSQSEQKWPSIPGWFTIFTAVFCAGLWVDNCTGPPSKLNHRNNHRIYKVIHSPKTKEEREGYGKVIFVTAVPDETNTKVIGNVFMCKVPDQLYDWAEYLDTVQIKPSECWNVTQ